MDNTTIPAHPGYYLLNVIWDGDGGPEKFEKTPVIAWQIIHGNTYPVGDEHSLADAIMRPDRSVYIPSEHYGEGKRCVDEAEALQHFVNEYNSLYTKNT